MLVLAWIICSLVNLFGFGFVEDLIASFEFWIVLFFDSLLGSSLMRVWFVAVRFDFGFGFAWCLVLDISPRWRFVGFWLDFFVRSIYGPDQGFSGPDQAILSSLGSFCTHGPDQGFGGPDQGPWSGRGIWWSGLPSQNGPETSQHPMVRTGIWWSGPWRREIRLWKVFLGFFGGLKAQYGYFLLGTHLFSINTCIMPLLLV